MISSLTEMQQFLTSVCNVADQLVVDQKLTDNTGASMKHLAGTTKQDYDLLLAALYEDKKT